MLSFFAAALWFGVPWSDALESFGTSLAFVGGVFVFAYDRAKTRRKEERSQAELVTSWFEIKRDPNRSLLEFTDPMRSVVRNNSKACIYNVETFVVGEAQDGVVSVIPPEGETSCDGYSESLGDLWGKERGIAIAFTDAGGRHWRRDEHGKLHALRKRDCSPPEEYLEKASALPREWFPHLTGS